MHEGSQGLDYCQRIVGGCGRVVEPTAMAVIHRFGSRLENMSKEKRSRLPYNRGMRRLLVIVALLAFIAGAAWYGGSLVLYAFTAAKAGTTTSSIILIHKGQAPNEIAKLLE